MIPLHSLTFGKKEMFLKCFKEKKMFLQNEVLSMHCYSYFIIK